MYVQHVFTSAWLAQLPGGAQGIIVGLGKDNPP